MSSRSNIQKNITIVQGVAAPVAGSPTFFQDFKVAAAIGTDTVKRAVAPQHYCAKIAQAPFPGLYAQLYYRSSVTGLNTFLTVPKLLSTTNETVLACAPPVIERVTPIYSDSTSNLISIKFLNPTSNATPVKLATQMATTWKYIGQDSDILVV